MPIATLLHSLTASVGTAHAAIGTASVGASAAIGALLVRRRVRRATTVVDHPRYAPPSIIVERQPRWPRTRSPDEAGARCFVDIITEQPRARWLDIGAAAIAFGESDPASLAAASDALDRALSEPGLTMSAWYVRDAVATAAALARCAPGDARASSVGARAARQRDHVDAARACVERAALAVLARPMIAPDAFDVLYAPIAHVEP